MPIFIQDGWERIPFEIDGFKYYVPSDKLLDELIGQADTQSQGLFQAYSNRIVKAIVADREYQSDTQKIEQTLCDLMGNSWDDYQRHIAILDYCNGVLPRQIYNVQSAITVADACMSIFKQAIEKGTINRIPKAFPLKQDSEGILIENPLKVELSRKSLEFDSSTKYFRSFWERVTGSLGDPIVDAPFAQYVQALHQMAKTNRKLPPVTGQKLLLTCQYCNRLFDMERGKSGKPKPHCGDIKCIREYGRLKPSKTSRRSTPIGWVKKYARKRCKYCERERVDLNSGFRCKKCFSENLSG
jgi:hypothetical protein